MKNKFKKLIKLTFFIIFNVINILIFIGSILAGFIAFAYGMTYSMSVTTEIIHLSYIIFSIILQIYLTIILIRNCIKYKNKTNVNIVFYMMLLYIINITNFLLYTVNFQSYLIFTIFYIVYFIAKERKVNS